MLSLASRDVLSLSILRSRSSIRFQSRKPGDATFAFPAASAQGCFKQQSFFCFNGLSPGAEVRGLILLRSITHAPHNVFVVVPGREAALQNVRQFVPQFNH